MHQNQHRPDRPLVPTPLPLVPTLCVGTHGHDAPRRLPRCAAERPESAFPRRAWERERHSTKRTGSVYIAVLGTSLIVSMLAMSVLALQRIQNRMLLTAADVRQAQLNAEAAIELGLLAIRQDEDWRTTYGGDDRWFTNRLTGAGGCSLDVIDPVDDDLTDDSNDPIVMIGIGYSGDAEQRAEVTIDPGSEPLECLRSAIVASDAITLSNSVLRTQNSANVSAASISASASTVYGNVAAESISGSTYAGTTTTVDSSDRPQMPDWDSVFDYYQANGTQINIGDIPAAVTNNFGRNVSVESALSGNDWIGNPPGVSAATVTRTDSESSSGDHSLRVHNRANWEAGAAQRIDQFVEPGRPYVVELRIRFSASWIKKFKIRLCTKGAASTVQLQDSSNIDAYPDWLVPWNAISRTVVAPSWNGALEYAFVQITGNENDTSSFYIDDLVIREAITGRIIYQKTLGPGVNPFGGATNSQGIYWIDCDGEKLYIERSRINGTLLVMNPGNGSCIGPGPIHWSPAVAGYPALLVQADNSNSADFAIAATTRPLCEIENGVNYNPSGAAHSSFGTDTDTADIYPSEINGLVVIGDDVTFENDTIIRGQIIAGDDISSSGGTLEVDYQPTSLFSPPPGFTKPAADIRPGSLRKALAP